MQGREDQDCAGGDAFKSARVKHIELINAFQLRQRWGRDDCLGFCKI